MECIFCSQMSHSTIINCRMDVSSISQLGMLVVQDLIQVDITVTVSIDSSYNTNGVYILWHILYFCYNQNQMMREMSLINVSHVGNRQMSMVWTAILLSATFAMNNGTST